MSHRTISNMEKLDLKSTDDRLILDMGKLGFQCVKAVGKYNYREIREKLEMHRHEGMLEICYLDKGTQYYNIAGIDYYMKGGDLLLTFPGEEHGTMDFPEEKGKLYWLILELPLPDSKRRILNLTLKESQVLSEKLLQLQPKRFFPGSPALKHNLDRVFHLYQERKETYTNIQITSLLLEFLLEVIRRGQKSTGNSMSELIGQVCMYIDKNIYEELILEEIAGKWHISLSHFKYRFKLETGIPPADYILRKKIEVAKELLQSGNRVNNTAYLLSFSSPSYFSTVFRRYTGKSPLQYTNEQNKISIR